MQQDQEDHKEPQVLVDLQEQPVQLVQEDQPVQPDHKEPQVLVA